MPVYSYVQNLVAVTAYLWITEFNFDFSETLTYLNVFASLFVHYCISIPVHVSV